MIKYNMCYKVFNEGEIHIYIYHKDISKSKSIELVSNLENISKNNIYTIGDNISKELCGGPHVKNTNELGHFKIVKEEASSAGVRRIKAILE